MKRYLLFLGDCYYEPAGGAQDFAGDFSTLGELLSFAKNADPSWFNILDTKENLWGDVRYSELPQFAASSIEWFPFNDRHGHLATATAPDPDDQPQTPPPNVGSDPARQCGPIAF